MKKVPQDGLVKLQNVRCQEESTIRNDYDLLQGINKMILPWGWVMEEIMIKLKIHQVLLAQSMV